MIEYLNEAAMKARSTLPGNGTTVELVVVPNGVMVRARRLVDVERCEHSQTVGWDVLAVARVNPLLYMIELVAGSLA